jgi:ribosomal protein S18 acetylase RimI-like enzyme
MEIDRLTSAQTDELLPELAALLQDAVAGGASVGFLPPLSTEEALGYWSEVVAALQGAHRTLLVARVDGRLAGTVQLDLASRPNGAHRAEVAKLMVHTGFRRRGIGQALMRAIEAKARAASRTTLVLDTRAGDPSEKLYTNLGFQRAGTIPQYARGADGSLHDTVYMYKLLKNESP